MVKNNQNILKKIKILNDELEYIDSENEDLEDKNFKNKQKLIPSCW